MAPETATPADQALPQIVLGQVSGTCGFPDAKRDLLLNQIHARFGDGLLAVLIYGSYLRGKRDTLLDFYVFVDGFGSMPSRWQGWLARALPPNVYQIHDGIPPEDIRAKYALMTLDQFERAVRDDFHSYFWARFAQPCGILYSRDDTVKNRIVAAICQASITFAERVVPRLPERFVTKQLWTTGLGLTYQCEFRSEPGSHAGKLFDYWPEYYRSVTLALAAEGLGFEPEDEADHFRNRLDQRTRKRSGVSWWIRRVQGKILSTLRLLKAAATFDDALDYLLWKIQRHSGVFIEPSRLQRRYPVVFAWPLLIRLWRKGAFR
jgi:hypothetical protein